MNRLTQFAAGIQLAVFLAATAGAVYLAGCSSSSYQPPPPITVTLSPKNPSPSVQTGLTLQFSAAVANTMNTAVTWQVNGVAGGNLATTGSISASGLFTAPAAIPNPATVTVTAVSQADATKSDSATVTITAAGPIAVTISPKRGGLTITQKLSLIATVTGDSSNSGVNWSFTSTGSTTGGSFSSPNSASGTPVTFTAPTAAAGAGVLTITATSVADISKSASATIGVTNLAGVYTYHNDISRDGVNNQEFALTTSNVKSGTFGKLFGCAVDGEVYAQPLWVPNLSISGGTHNVVFVATENDSVYAFDADATPCAQYWKKSFLSAGVTPIPPADTGEANDINTSIGITGTPVIDPATQTLYVVAKTKEGTSNYHQRLHALSLIDGSEKFSGPVDLTQSITVSGNGDQGDGVTCNSVAGQVPFCPLHEGQRAGLALGNGRVYVAWASHGDFQPYHGWVMSFNPANLQQAPVLFNDSPNGIEAGIWMSGGAPAFDSSGNLFVITGNGDYDGVVNFGETILKFNSSLVVQDWFTPNVVSTLNAGDLDLGSGGAVVLVDLPATSPVQHILIGGGKGVNQVGTMYVINRDTGSMGQNANPDLSVQQFNLNGMIYSTAAFWQNTMYIAAVGQQLGAFALNPATSMFNPIASSHSAHSFAFPGATPSVSSNGTTNGIVWALDTNSTTASNASGTTGPTILFAYDATNLGNELWDSTQGNGNTAGNAVKFCVPVVANGKVYVGTKTELDVYGLLPN